MILSPLPYRCKGLLSPAWLVVVDSCGPQPRGCGQTKKERKNMTKNTTRKGLAFGAGLALGLTSLVAMPAQAAAGDISLSPTAGSNYAVFASDAFSIDADTSALVPGPVSANLSYRIENPDQHPLLIQLTPTADTASDDIDINTYSSLGAAVLTASYDIRDTNGSIVGSTGFFVVDFAAADETTLVISDIEGSGIEEKIKITVLNDGIGTDGALIDSAADALARLGYGNGDASITIQAYAETGITAADRYTVEAAYASDVEAINWYDAKGVSAIPRIERFETTTGVVVNDDTGATTTLGATIQFGKTLNLEQVTMDDYDFELVVKDPDASIKSTVTEFYYGSVGESKYLSDFSVRPSETADRDDVNKLYFAFTGNDTALPNTHNTVNGTKELSSVGSTQTTFTMEAESSYSFSINRLLEDGSTLTNWVTSPEFALPSKSVTAVGIEASVTTEDVSSSTGVADTAFTVEAGTKSVTYTAQLSDNVAAGDGTAVDEASVPVLVSVKSATYLDADGSYVVSGTPSSISALDQTVFTTGFTDADGKFSVTVTSATAAAGESYVVTYHLLRSATWTDATAYTVTYATASPETFEADSSVLGGDTVVASFSVADAFGAGTNVSGTKDLSVLLTGSNTDDLEEFVAVAADGTATVSFSNYLTQGQSDLLTATLVTGTLATNTTVLGPITLTLYNTADVSAVTVPASYTGAITHADFVVGKVSATNPAPGGATAQIVGTAVDANGSGIPGAAVTIAADGMQFKKSGSAVYAVDTLTVVADAAGVFTVDVWTHMVTGSTGAAVTITTAEVSTSTLIKSYLPQAMTGDNLVFALDIPETIVQNITYAMKVTLHDKWGNPVETDGGDGAVEVVGVGSVLVNNVDGGVSKDFDENGELTVFIRSIKDIPGPGSIEATLQSDGTYSAWTGSVVTTTETLVVTETAVDDETTVWLETAFANDISEDVDVLVTAPTASADQKVNVGSFKGYVALYAKGYEGQKMSAIVAGKWIVVESLDSDYERVVRFTGAGYTITTKLYIDGVQVGDDFTTLTK